MLFAQPVASVLPAELADFLLCFRNESTRADRASLEWDGCVARMNVQFRATHRLGAWRLANSPVCKHRERCLVDGHAVEHAAPRMIGAEVGAQKRGSIHAIVRRVADEDVLALKSRR